MSTLDRPLIFPILAELGLPDDVAVVGDILQGQRQGFRTAQAGRRQQREQCCVGHGAYRAFRVQACRCLQQCDNLLGGIEIRRVNATRPKASDGGT